MTRSDLTITAPKKIAAKLTAPKIKPPAEKDRLYVDAKRQDVDELTAWVRSWGFSGELLAEGRKRYFDIRQPAYWNAERRRRFRLGLKVQAELLS